MWRAFVTILFLQIIVVGAEEHQGYRFCPVGWPWPAQQEPVNEIESSLFWIFVLFVCGWLIFQAITAFMVVEKIRSFLQRQRQRRRRLGTMETVSISSDDDEQSENGQERSTHDAAGAQSTDVYFPLDGGAGTRTLGRLTPSTVSMASHLSISDIGDGNSDVGIMDLHAPGWPLENE